MNERTSISWPERLRQLSCAVVIPTYNNAETLNRVIEGVKGYCSDIFVVNDGSTDSTEKILAEMTQIHTIAYKRNRGKGYALRMGLHAAADAGFRYAITIDSDGQHYPDDIPVFAEYIEHHPDRLLVGERNLTAENMPKKNSFANRFSNFWYRMETGRKLNDTQSGFRLYPLQKIGKMKTLCRRYEFEVEIIVRATWHGIDVTNIPIRVYYAPKDKRVSHFRPWRDFTRISLLNTMLVLEALLLYYPWRFVRSLTRENIRHFIHNNITHSGESNLRIATAMGWGIFCGIIPFWGYQMIFAGVTAHLLKLNKIIAIVFSNISIPPMIPVILYGSYWLGGKTLGLPVTLTFEEISFQHLTGSLLQYIAGSFMLATVCGMATTAVGWLLMTLLKRQPDHE